MPEPAVIRKALDLYQEALRKPSLTALCFDFSGSMEDEGEKQLQAAAQFLFTPEKASEVLVQWTPSDHIIVLPFDSVVRDNFDATGDAAGQSQLLAAVARQHAGGGTDMYACAQQALQKIAATADLSKYLPAIVIMTDGRTDGSADVFLDQWRSAPVARSGVRHHFRRRRQEPARQPCQGNFGTRVRRQRRSCRCLPRRPRL